MWGFAGARVRPDSDEAYLREKALNFVLYNQKPGQPLPPATQIVADAKAYYEFMKGDQ